MKQLLNTLFVMTEDAYLALENDNVVIYQNDQTLAKVPLRSIEGIMCFSYKGASPALMGRCGKLGVSMAFYSPRGHYYCSVLGEENRNVLLRREQFRVADDEQKSLRYAKSFIVGKLYNAKWVLERTKRDHALRVNIDRLAEQSGKLSAALSKARKSLTIDELRGVEGLAAKDYFYAFDDLVLKNKDDFFFTSRSRRPPLDRLNALLSFCYSILTNDCIAALQGVGLDPYVGFMHTDRPGRASLALDLVEEFRPVLADRFVLTLVNTGAVKPGDFEIRENGGVLLSDFGWGGLYPSRPASYSKGSRNGRQPRVYLTYLLLFLKKLRICEHILNCDANVYFANSTALVSRITLTFIWPGYSSSVSMRLTISFAMMIVSASLTFSGLTSIRISRPA